MSKKPCNVVAEPKTDQLVPQGGRCHARVTILDVSSYQTRFCQMVSGRRETASAFDAAMRGALYGKLCLNKSANFFAFEFEVLSFDPAGWASTISASTGTSSASAIRSITATDGCLSPL